MRVIQGKLEDLLEHAEPSDDWIRAELTDKELIPYALERLRMSYPNVMELVYLYQEEQIAASNTEVKLVPEQSLSGQRISVSAGGRTGGVSADGRNL